MEETGEKRIDNAEVWRPVVTHAGFYEVSNLGRVKRLACTTKSRNQYGAE